MPHPAPPPPTSADMAARIHRLSLRWGGYAALAADACTALGRHTEAEAIAMRDRLYYTVRKQAWPRADMLLGMLLATGCGHEWLLWGRGGPWPKKLD